MNTLQAIVLAIIEGITEFLPVSSTGHMIIASSFFGIAHDDFTKLFTIVIQLGAILSVVILYFKRFFQTFDFYFKLLVAFIPAVVLGLLLSDFIDGLLENPVTVAVSLLIGGIILLKVDEWFNNPNTAETSFYGLVEAAQDFLNQRKNNYILENRNTLTAETLQELLAVKIRTEKVAIKDAKLRTFITEDSSRDDLVAHVYDVTYGVIKPEDNLVIIDDSIVRGTTLKMSIIKMMDRLKPKRIVIVSSAPQIRYPDCYGIDMAKLEGLVAFRAALALLKERNLYHIVDEVYAKCKAQENFLDKDVVNYVTAIYDQFTPDEISDKIAEMLSSPEINAEVKIIFQTVDDLHKACPKNLGDWYFTGDYPTPGGNRVVNRAFMNFYEGKDARAY